MLISFFGSFDIGYSLSTNDKIFKIKENSDNIYYNNITLMSEEEDTCGNKISLGLRIRFGYGLLVDVTGKEIHKSWDLLLLKYLETRDFVLRFKGIEGKKVQDISNNINIEKIYLHILPFGVCFIERIYNLPYLRINDVNILLNCLEYAAYGNSNLSNSSLISTITHTFKWLFSQKIILKQRQLIKLTKRKLNLSTEYFKSFSILLCTYKNERKKIVGFLERDYEMKNIVKNSDYYIYAGWKTTCLFCLNKKEVMDYFLDWKFFFKYFNYLDILCNVLLEILSNNTNAITQKYVSRNLFNIITFDYLQRLKIIILLGYNNSNYESVSITSDVIEVYKYYERFAFTSQHRNDIKSIIDSLTEITINKFNKKISVLTFFVSVLSTFFAALAIKELGFADKITELVDMITNIFANIKKPGI